MLTTSAAGLAFIARWEGERLEPYKDAAGVPTIGIGHAIRAGEDFSAGITHEQALELLARDVHTAEAGVRASVKVDLTQNAFDALVDFAYNLGTGALASSGLLRLLNAGDYTHAAAQFPQWCHRKDPKTGQLVTDAWLLRRRMAEQELFLAPDAPAPADRTTQPELPSDDAA
jgi:lysozyme